MHPQGYVPRHSLTGTPAQASPSRPRRPRSRRRPRRLLVVVGGALAGAVVLAVGAWLALRGTQDPATALAEFCRSADSYFDPATTLPQDPDGIRTLVARRVDLAADMARKAPEEIRKTATAHASDMEAARRVFERHGYAPSLLNEALGGTLDSEDIAAVLRALGFSYSGDATGERAALVAAYRNEHCQQQ